MVIAPCPSIAATEYERPRTQRACLYVIGAGGTPVMFHCPFFSLVQVGRSAIVEPRRTILGNEIVPFARGRKQEASMAIQDSPSLYERLGGVYSIATVIDDFIDRVMADPRLNANPRVNEAHHRVPPAGFKYLVTEMVCWAAGGPQKYTGQSMKDSHQELLIKPAEWDAFLEDLQQTLDKFAVPKAEQAEIRAIVASTQADIVV
jgi:hemoglobin